MPVSFTTRQTHGLNERVISGAVQFARIFLDLNLGMGWLYYGLARLIRPTRVVVIGCWRGFAPLVFGKALADNAEGGTVTFIDPSLIDDTWANPEEVQTWFNRYDG